MTATSSSAIANPARPQRGWLRLSTILPLLVLVIGLFVTSLLWQSARQNALQMLQAKFDFRVNDTGDDIMKRMKTYEEVMRGVDGLFSHAEIVRRSEFHNYISRLQLRENYPGIQGIRFSPIVPQAQKDRHIADMRKQGLSGYTIHPYGKRDFYTPVVYVEPPDERNRQIFGYDTYSDLEHPQPGDSGAGLRRAAMERARDTGQTTISGKIKLLFETDIDSQFGFLMFMPVYRHGAPHNTLEERRANIVGWISSVFRAGDLMSGILGDHASEVDIDLYDGAAISENSMLHDPDKSGVAQDNDFSTRFRKFQPIEIAGHKWTLQVSSRPVFDAEIDETKQQFIAIGGAGASMLLALLAWLLVYGRECALQTAAVVERESRKNETLLRAASDSIHILDPGGNVVQANDAFCRMLGYTHDEIMSMNVAQWDAQFSLEELRSRIASLINSSMVFETRHRRRDGSFIDVEISAVGVKIDGQQLLYCSGRDITERKEAGQALAESRERLHTIIETALDAVVMMDAKGAIIGWNAQAQNIFGWSSSEAIGRMLHETVIPPRYREAHVQGMNRFMACGAGSVINSRIEISALHRDGHEFPVELTIAPIKTGGTYEFSGFIRDITRRKQDEEALRKSEALLKQTQEITKVGGWDYDVANRKMYWTDEVYRLYEVNPDNYDPNISQDIKFYTPGDQAIIGRAFNRAVESGDPYDLELRITSARGAHKWIRTTAQAARTSGKVTRVFGNIMDITDRKLSEEKIWQQANFDSLTGLPNRRMFRERLIQEVKKAQRTNLPLALMFIDLDRFKEVNDTLGHDMGDSLLIEAAQRLGDCTRSTDMVARLGGDEFTVVLAEVDEISSIERIAQNILQKLSEPFQLGDDLAYVSASIGITLYPNDAAEIENLLKNADQAMYVAKEKGRNRHSYFTHSMQEAAQARLKLINDLRGALADRQFRVHFQPITDMATGRINKAEALIRWQHPERGLVSPMEFIPLAEETGLIFEIGDWVFHESVRWAKRWRELYNSEFQISVNKSPIQFYKDGDDHSAWLKHLLNLGLPGQSLVIEITEGLLLDSNAPITGALLTFRDAGIQVAIDDFGTGYSSLSYLKKFDIDYLKIDKSFTGNLAPGSSDMALSEAIIVMAHKLGFKVIAEGVETAQQRDLLAGVGCDYAQGYLYSKPVPPEEFEVLLKGNLPAGQKH